MLQVGSVESVGCPIFCGIGAIYHGIEVRVWERGKKPGCKD